MQKIYNAYNDIDGHYCFACSKSNPIGLKMEFYEDGDEIISKWQPGKQYSGFYNILHGGIQAVLIDEIAAWCVQIKQKTSGVTTTLKNRYKKPVYIDKGEITLRAKITDAKRNLLTIEVKLFDSDGILCTESELQFFAFPPKIAEEKFYYPGYESFFKEV